MDKQIVVHVYSGILLSNKKKWMIDTCHNFNGSQEYYAEWKSIWFQNVKHCIIPFYITSLKCQKYSDGA